MKPYLAIVLIFFCIQNITTRKLRSKSKSKLKDKFFDLVPKTPQIFEHIVLTPEEEVLFDYLQNIGQEEFKNNNVVIKVVGGWVRDKLLGRPANDIDIIIDGLNDPLSAIKFAHKASNNNDDVVKWEMDGLEVGTTKIKGLLIDVASRTDTCPISGFTVRSLPLEDDAEQRDFTINSLHYDIVLQKVEDWTNKGMNDLKAGI